MSRFHHQDYTFGESVHALGIVTFLQRGTERPRKGLIETGFHGTEKRLNQIIGLGVTLAIDKFDEQLSLRIGELFHAWRIFLFYVFLHQFHVLILRFFIGQRL